MMLYVFLLALLPAQSLCQTEFGSAPVRNVADFSSAGVESAVNAPTDGTTDATPAVLAAIAALPPSGGQLYFPAGTYLLTQALNISNVPVAIVGDGMSLSVLRWSPAAISSGILVSQASTTALVTVHDISLYTDVTAAARGVALTIDLSSQISPTAGNVLQDRVSPRASIENVDVRHARGEVAGGWQGGVYLHNALHITINRVHFTGYNSNTGPKTASEFGIKIDGSGSPVEIDLSQVWMQFCQFGVEITGTVEGVSITQANMVAVVVGVSSVTASKPQLALSQSHIAAYVSGIVATGSNSLNVYSCLIYAFADRPAGQTFIGINVSQSTGNVLNMNQFADTSTVPGMFTAIAFDNVDFSSVANNICLTPVTAFSNVLNPVSRLDNFANNICEGQINDSG